MDFKRRLLYISHPMPLIMNASQSIISVEEPGSPEPAPASEIIGAV